MTTPRNGLPAEINIKLSCRNREEQAIEVLEQSHVIAGSGVFWPDKPLLQQALPALPPQAPW